ncbi:MAG: 1-acyl-sn-glycerol-3-phosphate acyltransferase, partial [Bacteroidota bacterium]
MARSDVTGADKGIHRRNLIYHLIYPYVKIFFFHYYGKVEIKGLENIPRGAPVIFAPNHQNALMDALIVLFAAPGDVVFLARADIFNSKFLAFLLNSLKILPVFRQRDGAAELVKNQEIFDISVDVLKHRHYLCVMPEGNHGNQRKLRNIVKGIFRIAFKAQEDAGNQAFVKIVPVGLDVGDYVKHNTSLFINFGEPIEVSDYWDAYEENTARGINSIKATLIEELKPRMIHIGTEAYYEAVQGLREIFNERMREMMEISGSELSDRFRADKEMIARIDAILDEAEAEAASESANEAKDPGKFDELA